MWFVTNGDILRRRPYDISCFMAVVRFPYEITCLLFLRVDCECNRPSFHATVFFRASSFNGDLKQWDVAKVTRMNSSKSIRIVENDVKSCCCDCRVQSGVWGWW